MYAMSNCLKKVCILGASGYTGAELLRLLTNHPQFEVSAVTGSKSAGESLTALCPHLQGYEGLRISPETDTAKLAAECDLLFCALPHGQAMRILPGLTAARMIDLGGDFRLDSAAAYETWYGEAHSAPSELGRWVYGLCELNREKICTASRIANPGCYATASILAAAPLMQHELAEPDLIISAVSGLSGAGKTLKAELHFAHAFEDVRAYKIGAHQHIPEIEQALNTITRAANCSSDNCSSGKVLLSFTPHLVPMTRGIHVTLIARARPGVTQDMVREAYDTTYKNARFVKVTGAPSGTKEVRGGNGAKLYPVLDQRTGKIVVTAVIDNLVKGAAGQALQNANLMFGLDEGLGLTQGGLYP